MKANLSLVLMLIVLTGCTVRGGWPRFLRPGEPSDSTLRKSIAESLREQRSGTVITNLRTQEVNGTNHLFKLGADGKWIRAQAQ